tara:strand:+ start:991 stop:1161 length:171 start_codon:yes stop_codon:yes gene_type:complete
MPNIVNPINLNNLTNPMMSFNQLPMQSNPNQMNSLIQIPSNQQLSAAGGVVPGTKT